jgi:hypothetical protein
VILESNATIPPKNMKGKQMLILWLRGSPFSLELESYESANGLNDERKMKP